MPKLRSNKREEPNNMEGDMFMALTIFQQINQRVLEQASETRGIDATQLVDLWKKAGSPRAPSELINFLKQHAKVDDDKVREIFQSAGIRLQQGSQKNTSLTPQSVEKIQKYISSLTIPDLRRLKTTVTAIDTV